MRFPPITLRFACLALLIVPALGQSPNGDINGLVLDPSSKVIVGAEIIAVNDVTGMQYTSKTNNEGIYVLPDLPPGSYRVQVSKLGFKTIIKPDIVLNVQDALSINFTLPVGATIETVTVEGGAPLVNTENATVSTVVDRQFAENLPMNGRSFQTLIYLTPGVVATAPNTNDNGQFSVNGQRTASNYWMVDGVSANIGMGVSVASSPGNGLGGAVGAFSALGGTNSLVSIDALQEFRIQTSTFAPEFGRTPGGQISIVTRSGTNQWHGTLFDYLRNDQLDANNWFNTWVSPPLPKAEERQNDFGGTFNGPILKNRAFFFFSYEGLRLRLPQTTLTNVLDLTARQSAVSSIRPFLDAYPLPNGSDNPATGIAQFNASYSNPASLDAYSLRLDHRLNGKWSFFGRYDYSPSQLAVRGTSDGFGALSAVQFERIVTQTATIGATWTASPVLTNDLRFNYSQVSAEGHYQADDFGGAVAPATLPFPKGYTGENGLFYLVLPLLGVGEDFRIGEIAHYTQHQINVVDSLTWQRAAHTLKFGIDVRRLSPTSDPPRYRQSVGFNNLLSAQAGMGNGSVQASNSVQFSFRNVGAFAQDTWRVSEPLTLTYGLRWDLDFAPTSLRGPSIPAVTGYSLTDFSALGIAPAGTPPFQTTYGNIAPRIGAAYQILRRQSWQTVIRGGCGLFYDLVNSETGDVFSNEPPFGNLRFVSRQPFPWAAAQTIPPAIPPTATLFYLSTFNPKLKLPYAIERNIAIEQALGRQQSVSASYVGASGKRLLQTTEVLSPPSNPALQLANFIDDTGSSSYNALQIQFKRRLSQGLQILSSYTWSHSIDDGSAGSFGSTSNLGSGGNASNRGDSDFDVRNAFTTGLTYDIPATSGNSVINRVARGWSVQNFVLLRSGLPVDLIDENLFLFASGINANIRPDVISGEPLYLHGTDCARELQSLGELLPSQTCPGGKAFNPLAFANPPFNPTTFSPTRQGDLARNTLRGFGAGEWDFAMHRTFSIREPVKLQFRAEVFNILNHPNFGTPNNQFGEAEFGLSQLTLAQSLSNGSVGAGGFNPLYQIGGPRSIQVALKLTF